MGKTGNSRAETKSVSFCMKSLDGPSLSPHFMNVETNRTAARVRRKVEGKRPVPHQVVETTENVAQRSKRMHSSASLSGSLEWVK